MPNLTAISLLSSTLILTILIFPSLSLDISSKVGARALQGPHQGAQKSTRTGTSDYITHFILHKLL